MSPFRIFGRSTRPVDDGPDPWLDDPPPAQAHHPGPPPPPARPATAAARPALWTPRRPPQSPPADPEPVTDPFGFPLVQDRVGNPGTGWGPPAGDPLSPFAPAGDPLSPLTAARPGPHAADGAPGGIAPEPGGAAIIGTAIIGAAATGSPTADATLGAPPPGHRDDRWLTGPQPPGAVSPAPPVTAVPAGHPATTAAPSGTATPGTATRSGTATAPGAAAPFDTAARPQPDTASVPGPTTPPAVDPRPGAAAIPTTEAPDGAPEPATGTRPDTTDPTTDTTTEPATEPERAPEPPAADAPAAGQDTGSDIESGAEPAAGTAIDPAEAAALAGAFAVDLLSWDEDDPARRGHALGAHLASPEGAALLGWTGTGRQRADLVLPGSVRGDGGRVQVDVRVRIVPYRRVGTRSPAAPEVEPEQPLGEPAAAPAPSARGWRGLAARWLRIEVTIARIGDRLVVDAGPAAEPGPHTPSPHDLAGRPR